MVTGYRSIRTRIMNRKRQIVTIATIVTVLAGSAFAAVPGAQDADSNDRATMWERGQMLNLLREDLMEDSEQSAVAIKPNWDLRFAQEQDVGQRDADH